MPPLPPARPVAGRDLLIVLAGTALVFVLAAHFEFHEAIGDLTRGYEAWQADELPTALLALALGLGWFGGRRYREARQAEARTAGVLRQNRLLARQLISIQEAERLHLARELHDELGQCCTAIKADAAAILQSAPATPQVVASAEAIAGVAEHLHGIVRTLLRELRPGALDDLGLAEAVQQLAEHFEQRHGIACRVLPEGDPRQLPETLSITAYRIVQECLTNVARHSGASQVTVVLRAGAAQLEIQVNDNGRGLGTGSQAPTGLGLVGMSERVEALGGRITLAAAEPSGLRVAVILPMEA